MAYSRFYADFSCHDGIVNDIYEIWYIVLGINICFAIGCLVKGLVSYKTKQFA